MTCGRALKLRHNSRSTIKIYSINLRKHMTTSSRYVKIQKFKTGNMAFRNIFLVSGGFAILGLKMELLPAYLKISLSYLLWKWIIWRYPETSFCKDTWLKEFIIGISWSWAGRIKFLLQGCVLVFLKSKQILWPTVLSLITTVWSRFLYFLLSKLFLGVMVVS